MTYNDFLKALNEPPFEYEIPIPKPPEPEPEPEPGKKKKRAKRTSDVWLRGSYSSGSSVALWQKWHGDEGKWCLLLKWEVGGTEGAGYWGGESRPYVSGTPEPSWTHLEDILEHFCPGITFLQFRQLERLIQHEDDGYSDYYGNSTKYALKVLPLEDLWRFLSEKKLLGESDV